MQFVLSIDQGTTGTRAMIFNKKGEEISKNYLEHKQFYPNLGWVEHNPKEIWENSVSVIRNALKLGNIESNQICSIGITNQRETVVVWDKETGEPLNNAIVWQCRRTAEICAELKKNGYEETFNEKTGLVLDPYFSGTKIRWLLENSEEIKRKVDQGSAVFGTIDSWLIWKLTGNLKTDYSNASRTLLFNIHSLEWDEELLEILKIPIDVLPEVRPSSDKDLFGYTKPGLFEDEIPVAGSAGDQQAALFGQTCFNVGEVKNTYGTGNFMLLNTGEKAVKSQNGLLSTIAWGIDNEITYALEGSVFITGAAIQWLEQGLEILDNKAQLTEIMNNTPDTQGVFFVPAFVGLGAPHWDPFARGTIVGLTRGTKREHIIRSALESICYQSEDVFEAMKKDSDIAINMIRVDGGVTNCSPLLQFQSDISNVIVQKPKINETTALGAAYLAGLAVDYWESLDDIRKNFLLDSEFKPTMSNTRRTELQEKWRKTIERAKAWIEK